MRCRRPRRKEQAQNRADSIYIRTRATGPKGGTLTSADEVQKGTVGLHVLAPVGRTVLLHEGLLLLEELADRRPEGLGEGAKLLSGKKGQVRAADQAETTGLASMSGAS